MAIFTITFMSRLSLSPLVGYDLTGAAKTRISIFVRDGRPRNGGWRKAMPSMASRRFFRFPLCTCNHQRLHDAITAETFAVLIGPRATLTYGAVGGPWQLSAGDIVLRDLYVSHALN